MTVQAKNSSFAGTSFENLITKQFKTERRKTKTKPITHQLDYSANLKP